MSAVMAQVEHPAVVRWRARFEADGAAALWQALTGRISLGPYDRARPADALAQILAEADLASADKSLQACLAGLLGLPTPEGLTAKRFAEALAEGFRLIVLLQLPKTGAWCVQHHGELRAWLRGFYFGRSRDPEATLLVALAQNQADRSLLNLWMSIVRRGRPIDHVRHALTGLRLMPADDRGAVERGVPRALLRGIMEFGEALARRRDERKGTDWFQELDYLAAVYPISKEQWGRRFREVVHAHEPSSTVKNWLDQRYPLALRPAEGRTARGPLEPPYFKEIEPLLQKVSTDLDEVRPRLQRFFEDSRHYCRESGDSSYLVRSFCFAGDRLLKKDPAWARELAHEAATWEPSDSYTWLLLASALEHEGDWRRSEAVYWQTRRRFPENPFSHNQLAHALLTHGNAELGETVYREAIRLFPDDPVCWTDLAQTLRVSGRLEEAVTVYREAKDHFHRDVAIATALADTLIGLNRLDEAEDAIAWAEQITPKDDVRSQQIVARTRERLGRAQAGQPIVLRKFQLRPEIAGGSLAAFADITGTDFSHAPALGRATLLRRKANGGLATARSLIDGLPDGPEKLIELGLWQAANKSWPIAARWFDEVWKRYEGDGVLRVHHQRARARAGDTVDWSVERTQYPELINVILTEELGKPPQLHVPENVDERSQEQQQDSWFVGLAARNDSTLLDRAEEDYLAARHLL